MSGNMMIQHNGDDFAEEIRLCKCCGKECMRRRIIWLDSDQAVEWQKAGHLPNGWQSVAILLVIVLLALTGFFSAMYAGAVIFNSPVVAIVGGVLAVFALPLGGAYVLIGNLTRLSRIANERKTRILAEHPKAGSAEDWPFTFDDYCRGNAFVVKSENDLFGEELSGRS